MEMRFPLQKKENKILRDIVHSPFVYGSWPMEMRFPLQTKSINSQLESQVNGSLKTIEVFQKKDRPSPKTISNKHANNFINYSSNKVKYSVI